MRGAAIAMALCAAKVAWLKNPDGNLLSLTYPSLTYPTRRRGLCICRDEHERRTRIDERKASKLIGIEPAIAVVAQPQQMSRMCRSLLGAGAFRRTCDVAFGIDYDGTNRLMAVERDGTALSRLKAANVSIGCKCRTPFLLAVERQRMRQAARPLNRTEWPRIGWTGPGSANPHRVPL